MPPSGMYRETRAQQPTSKPKRRLAVPPPLSLGKSRYRHGGMLELKARGKGKVETPAQPLPRALPALIPFPSLPKKTATKTAKPNGKRVRYTLPTAAKAAADARKAARAKKRAKQARRAA